MDLKELEWKDPGVFVEETETKKNAEIKL